MGRKLCYYNLFLNYRHFHKEVHEKQILESTILYNSYLDYVCSDTGVAIVNSFIYVAVFIFRPIQISQQLDTAKVTENVVRQPKGPDGSKGFGDRDIPR